VGSAHAIGRTATRSSGALARQEPSRSERLEGVSDCRSSARPLESPYKWKSYAPFGKAQAGPDQDSPAQVVSREVGAWMQWH
jgi:hypothetical protein